MPAGRSSGSASITGSAMCGGRRSRAIVFGFRHHLEIFAENGLAASRVFAADGGAASDLWLQIAADGLGLPVRRIDRHPGSCLGAAFVAGIGIGAIADFDRIEAYVEQGRLFRPAAAEVERHEPSLPAVAGDLYEVEIPLSPTHLRENPGGSVAGCRFSAQAGNKNAALAPSLCSASRKFRCAAQEQLPRHFRRSKAGFAFARTSSVLLRCFGSLEPAGRQSGRFFIRFH